MKYKGVNFKVPTESKVYKEDSDYVIKCIEKIIQQAISSGNNKIIINTNLRIGLPMENINKIAGPMVEAWAFETFSLVMEDATNVYKLVNVEAKERLYKADVILQFRRTVKKAETVVTSEVDVKATAQDIENSGKSPNITSYAVIRSAYVEEPDLIFIILSLKHKVSSQRNTQTKLMDGVMEVVDYNAYDIKYLSSSDISYNPALGTGQIQIRDIHYVETADRTVWEFCQLLDQKYISSKKHSFEDWLELAKKYKWIKEND